MMGRVPSRVDQVLYTSKKGDGISRYDNELVRIN